MYVRISVHHTVPILVPPSSLDADFWAATKLLKCRGNLRFQVSTPAVMKMAVFLDVAPHGLV